MNNSFLKTTIKNFLIKMLSPQLTNYQKCGNNSNQGHIILTDLKPIKLSMLMNVISWSLVCTDVKK